MMLKPEEQAKFEAMRAELDEKGFIVAAPTTSSLGRGPAACGG